MSFKKLKEQSAQALEQIKSATSEKQSYDSENYWKPTINANGDSNSVIRFIPDKNNKPFIQYYSHFFKGKTGWYVEKSRSTIGEKDPVGDYNAKLWKQGDEGQAKARSQKRKLKYVSNVYIIKDEANSLNEGKVFKFEYGAEIMNILKSAWEPDFDDDPIFNPFDMWEGAALRLRTFKKDTGFVSYSKSKFDKQSPLLGGDDDKLQDIYENLTHALNEYTDPESFKTYNELLQRLNTVTGIQTELV